MHEYFDADQTLKGFETIPKCDTIEKPKTHDYLIKDLYNYWKAHNLSTEGNTQVILERCNKDNSSIPTKEKYGNIIKGHVGL